MTEMIQMFDLQQAVVADHIADLEREGAALRAERERDHLREHAATGGDATDHPADLAPRRVRLGRWLIRFGAAIAGTSPAAIEPSPSPATIRRAGDDPCGDEHDRLARAA